MIGFDEFENMEDHDNSGNSRPLWTIDLDAEDNEKAILKWLANELDFLNADAVDRIDDASSNLRIYNNRHEDTDKVSMNKATQLFQKNGRTNAISRVRVNHVFDLVEQSVSRLIKFRPAVAILPTNDEFEDRLSAEVADLYWKHIKEVNDFDGKVLTAARSSKIGGEAHLGVFWDPDEGEEVEDSVAARKKNKKLYLRDDDGEIVEDESGHKIEIPLPIKTGDVCHEVIDSWDVRLQKKAKFTEVEYAFIKKDMDVDEIRLRYPKKSKEIKGGTERIVDMINQTETSERGRAVVWRFFHKKTKAMPFGREIVFTRDAILDNRKLRYDHGKLPLNPLVDIVNPVDRHGLSSINNVKVLAKRINDLTTMIVRNQMLAAHPKWFVPKGSVKIETLENDMTICQYQGAQPPVLGQQSPTPVEVFNFRDKLKEDMQQVYGVFGSSRGQPPPGIKAGIALQFLEEQENQRQNSSVAQYNSFIRSSADMTISVAAQFYDPKDDRTLMVLGKNNDWMIEELDPRHLAKKFSIRIQNSSALPESKSARIQTLLDVGQSFPGMIPNDQMIDLLDIGGADKFYDLSAAAARKAMYEDNEIMSKGRMIEAEKWELQIEHWEVHSRTIQGLTFMKSPKKERQRLLDHLMTHEMFMLEQVKIDPAFGQRLMALKQFPILMVPEIAPPPVMPPPEPPPEIKGTGSSSLGKIEGAEAPAQEQGSASILNPTGSI